MIKLTEEILHKAGGWQVMKEARTIHGAGRVVEVSYVDGLLKGIVKGAGVEFASGLRIRSASDMDNLCTCVDARKRGIICGHSIAVGLAFLKPAPAAAPVPAPAPPPPPVVQAVFSPDADGPAVALHIILPPDFRAAWEKNHLICVVEAVAGAQRKPFGTLAGGTWKCDAADARFASAMLPLSGGAPASMIMLNREQIPPVLTSLAGHPRVTFGRKAAVLAAEPVTPVLTFSLREDHSLDIACEPLRGLLQSRAGAWLLTDNTLRAVAPGLPPAYLTVLAAPVHIPAEGVAGFMEKELARLSAHCDCQGVEIPPPTAAVGAPAEGAGRTAQAEIHLHLEGSLNHLTAKFPAGATLAAARRLTDWGFTLPDAKGVQILREERAILTFFAGGLPALERDWKVVLGERFQNVTENVDRIEPRLEIRSSGEQWFDLAYDFHGTGGGTWSHAEVARMLQSGQSHTRRPDGKIAVCDAAMLDDFSQLLRDSNPTQTKPGVFRLQRRNAGALHAFADESGIRIQGNPAWQTWAGASRNASTLTPIDLGDLEGTLRPYQKHGASWLQFLGANGLGGILADEMGLGKTLQTLAWLRTLRGTGPSLIVCPSSLLFNWQAEAARWTPELNVLLLEGPRRAESFAGIPQADIVITSYALLRADIESHQDYPYAAAVLDEAQHIKNPDSQNARSATALRATRRFALTGTPVENSVRDLWSIMHFLMPGYLGTRKEFKERYEGPITQSPGGPEQRRLSRRLQPFLLRRLKADVAADLPARLEQVAWCELTPTQRELYTQLASTTRRQLTELSGPQEQKKSRMVMLTALLRLRQAACDLRLLDPGSDLDPAAASAKLDLLMELLTESIDGGHHVLVFSQFVTMLGNIRPLLEAAGIDYCYLDGSSRDRQAQVTRFQKGNVPVFLISLKAGGTGLNLTAADTVIHFDPWWNPAVEAQATDRAHRIGQNRVVTSYKLIARGTVEEKILHLQEKKKSIIAATLESEQPLMEGLTMDEIASLLE